MSTSTQKVIRMTFSTTNGSTFRITLPAPRPDLTAAEAELAMDLIIQKNLYTTPGGDLIGKRDIKLIQTTIDDIFDLPGA